MKRAQTRFELGAKLRTSAALNFQFRLTVVVPAPVRRFLSGKSSILWQLVTSILATEIWRQVVEHVLPIIVALLLGGQ
jgi:hypothetical protein